MVYAPNFSIGVQVLRRLVAEAARGLAGRTEFDAFLVELHHRAKKDASGTARDLQGAMRAADPTREVPITSIRAGQVPGTHEVHFEGPGETITLRHAARDRGIFARGALHAARWLAATPRRGVFTFEQTLFGDRP